jgi:hypothetical protein
MQRFQVRKNNLEYVINFIVQHVERLKKDGIKRRIKQTLVKRIIYQQGILKHRTRKLNKEMKKVFTKN